MLTFTLRSLCFSITMTSSFIASSMVLAAQNNAYSQNESTHINHNPQRIIALGDEALDISLSLDSIPIGASTNDKNKHFPSYLGDRTKGIHIVGNVSHINLKDIQALHPDIILVSQAISADQHHNLANIAPTIVPTHKSPSLPEWEEDTLTFANALGKTEEANAVLGNIRDQESDLKNLVTVKLTENTRHAAIAYWPTKEANVLPETSFAASVLTATGFTVVDKSNAEEMNKTMLPDIPSLQNIKSNWWFLASSNPKQATRQENSKTSKEFNQFDAKQKDHITNVNSDVWVASAGPIAASQMLNDLQTMLDEKVPYPQ